MAALALLFVVRAGEGIAVAVGGGFAVHAQLRRHLYGLAVLGERYARPACVDGLVDHAVDGLFAGEERQQALLQRVFFIMPNELYFHVNGPLCAQRLADIGVVFLLA